MTEPLKVEALDDGFPPPMLPSLYCDGIANLAPTAHVMKFYLLRIDPDQLGKPRYKNQIIAQVVMPIPAFIQAYLFFERGLKQFTEQGTISQQLVDEITRISKAELEKI